MKIIFLYLDLSKRNEVMSNKIFYLADIGRLDNPSKNTWGEPTHFSNQTVNYD